MTFELNDFLEKSKKAQASDIHLNSGKVPALRINGVIYKITADVVTFDDIKNILFRTMPTMDEAKFDQLQNIDYMYELKGVGRFRINYCREIFGGKLSFRLVPYEIKTLEELRLPPCLSEYTTYNNGIVILTGATGSGKTTTLASLIEQININQKKHIVTIEDPVEYVYEDKKSIVTQRSLETDVADFKTGIKYAMRQDPDVLLVGEIRDGDTLLSAIEAAETGHLVYSTLHTNGTIQSINRLRGIFEASNNQESFVKRISTCIRAIAHQQLVPSVKDGALIPALELLTFTSTVVDYIQKEQMGEIYPLMQRSKQANLQTMNASLFSLYQKGLITKETAIEYSLEKVEMDHMLRGIYRNDSSGEC